MAPRRKRQRGKLEWLPSGSCRVRVYAGKDPVSGRTRYLEELVRAHGTERETAREAEKVRTRLVNQLDERRNPRTKATVNQLIDRWLDVVEVERTTRRGYVSNIEKHVRPLIGSIQVGQLSAETIDAFYSELRRCRDHCARGRRYVQHRTDHSHECDGRCRPHQCKPLAAGSIRVIHSILSGALTRALRWGWISVNPLAHAERPSVPTPDPHPPSAEEAARILNEAWKDPDWGTLVWLAMVTGARRGEMSALRWAQVDLDNALLTLHRSIGQYGGETWEKDTKTHQRRRVALDPDTVDILREHRERCETRAASLELTIPEDGFVFSHEPDCSAQMKPNTVTQRYGRLARRLGIDTHLHALRHYSATELITAGVDPRTVAGRLGHGGGGSTTLRVYSAWVSEADQRAALSLLSRMPRPDVNWQNSDTGGRPTAAATMVQSPRQPAPYECLANTLKSDIDSGKLRAGDMLPSFKDLADRDGVSFGTAQRAVALLREWGLVEVARGRRATIRAPRAS